MHIVIQMNLNFLPTEYITALNNIKVDCLYEIRLRTGYPVKANYCNQDFYLFYGGLTNVSKDAIFCDKEDINFIISQITEHSLYAYNDRLKEGFLTTLDGIRVGIAGECVFSDNKIHTIKNFSSLNIRIPHEIEGCSKKILPYIYNKNCVYSAIIVSPPFLGKTTLLKDILKNINDANIGAILVIDERGEFNLIKGENIDNILYSNKNYAFNCGVRSLSPKIIITDELSTNEDWLCAKNAITSGIKIIASCHSDDIEKLKNKPYFINNLFDRYIVLKNEGEFGQVKYIFDKDFNILCDYS